MSKTIEFDGKQHVFPDDFSDADISTALASVPAPSSMAADVAKSGGIGLAKGALGLAGLPGDARELGLAGLDKAASIAGYTLPTDTINSFLKRAPAMLGGGPTSQELQSKIEGVTGKFYEPQTVAGRFAQTAGEFAPAVLGGPEALGAKLLTRVAAPAAASTAVGELGGGPIAQTAAALVGGAAAGKIARSVTPTGLPKIADVQDVASQTYKNIENATVGVPFSNRDVFVTDLKDTLHKAAKREANVAEVYAAIDSLPAKADIADLVILQKNLTPLTGREGVAARMAIQKVEQELDRAVPGIGASLKEADKNWNAFRTAEGLDKRTAKAELQTAATHSGTNLGNKLKQAAAAAATGPQSRFMKQDEIKALENVARGTFTQNRLRDVGNLLGGGVGLGGLVAGEVVGGHEGGILGGLGTIAAGRFSRAAYNRAVAQQAKRVQQQVLARSPLAQQMGVTYQGPQGLLSQLRKAPLLPLQSRLLLDEPR